MNGRSLTCLNWLIQSYAEMQSLISLKDLSGFCSTSQTKFAMIFFDIDEVFWCFIDDDAIIYWDFAWYYNLISGKILISQLEKDLPHAVFPPSLKAESSSTKTCFCCTVQSLTMNNTFLIEVQADLLLWRVQKGLGLD